MWLYNVVRLVVLIGALLVDCWLRRRSGQSWQTWGNSSAAPNGKLVNSGSLEAWSSLWRTVNAKVVSATRMPAWCALCRLMGLQSFYVELMTPWGLLVVTGDPLGVAVERQDVGGVDKPAAV